jgi:transcriptional regulator of NAD metabolism
MSSHKGEERRELLLEALKKEAPLTGSQLSSKLHVSRQVIVNDIALLRARGVKILSTTKGYLIMKQCERVFKCRHTNSETRHEYELIVDLGGVVEDIFVYHRSYGVVKAALHLSSRKDIDDYFKNLEKSQSSPLENITYGYHYHTVQAKSEALLDCIQDALDEAGYLAQLVDYEPVDFKKNVRVQ